MGKVVNISQFSKVEITNYEELNDELMRCKIKVMHHGINDNGYNIDKKVIEKALDTIYYIPIVGEVVEYENGTSFGDHAMSKNEDGDIICNTVPFGVVAGKLDNEIEWIDIDGKEYFTCIGYLWKRYDLVEKFESQDFYQSMEIGINKSRKKRNKNIVDVLDFNFSALCILNKDLENYENSVAPCFDEANIEKFSKNKFAEEFKELVGKVEVFEKKGGDAQMALDKDIKKCQEDEEIKDEGFAKEEETEEVETAPEEDKETPEEETEAPEEDKEESFAKDEEEANEEPQEETNEEDEKEEEPATFSLTLDETTKQIRQALNKRTIEVEYWGNKYQENEFYFNTLFEVEGLGTVVVVNDNKFENQYFIPYSIEKDVVTLDFEAKVKCISTYRVFEGEEEAPVVESFAKKLEDVRNAFEKRENSLQSTVAELKEFRRAVEFAKREETVLETIAKFDFEEEEVAVFKKQAIEGEIGIETLELNLFALAGKKALFAKEKADTVKFSKKNTVSNNPYGDLVK